MKTEYFLFNLVVIVCPLFGALVYPKAIKLHPRTTVLAVLTTALPFILIDQIVTNHFWSFNPHYILGLMFGQVPFEEVLFFLTVPAATLFLWVNAARRMVRGTLQPVVIRTVQLAALILSAYACIHGKLYTCTVLLAFVVLLFFNVARDIRVWKFQLFVFPLILIFNMYLTARAVVLYNTHVISGLFIGTIPVEDFLYGAVMVTFCIGLYQYYLSASYNNVYS